VVNHKDRRFDKDYIINASEIAQYRYCSISWYLHRSGVKTKSNLIKQGINKHREFGIILNKINRNSNRSLFYRITGIILLLLSILIFLWDVIL
jgi:hypothetical protein